MTDLQVFVLTVFTIINITLSVYNYGVRHPAPTSRREQIARIRAEKRNTSVR